MKALYLISNVKDNPTFLLLDVKESLDNFSDLVEEAISNKKVINGFTEVGKIAGAVKTKVNFQGVNTTKKTIKIDSPLTEKLLSGKIPNVLSVVVICVNQQGKRIGYICAEPNGDLMRLSDKTITEAVKTKKIRLSNMFMRNGKELVATDAATNIPVLSVGTRLTTKELAPKEGKGEIFKADGDLSKYRPVIRAMILKGYGSYISKFRLNNKQYSDTTLELYLQLMDNKEFDIIANMLTTQPFTLHQLLQIADGLRLGVDIKKYADVDIDHHEMEKIKDALYKGSWDSKMTPLTKRLKTMVDDMKGKKVPASKVGSLINKYKTAVNKKRK